MDNKYTKVRRMSGERIDPTGRYEVTEKIDGANFSFFVGNDGELICRSRRMVITDNSGKFTKCVEYVKMIHGISPFDVGVIYFGECMTKRTIRYGDTPPFIGFGLLDPVTEAYLAEWHAHYDVRHIPRVPHAYITGANIGAYIDNNLINKSAYGDTCATQEGIVFKCYETQRFVKVVRDEFREDNKKVFSGTLVPDTETGTIVARFCTHSRIEKSVFALRDEHDIDVSILMMKHVPIMVCDDIISEEFMTIYAKYKSIDFNRFRKLVAGECVKYFKQLEEE